MKKAKIESLKIYFIPIPYHVKERTLFISGSKFKIIGFSDFQIYERTEQCTVPTDRELQK